MYICHTVSIYIFWYLYILCVQYVYCKFIHSACISCQSRLPSNRLSEDEVNKLNHYITDMITKKVSSLPSSDCDLKEMERLNEMISAHSPFHYVMDSANVGHTGETSFSFNKVINVLSTFHLYGKGCLYS